MDFQTELERDLRNEELRSAFSFFSLATNKSAGHDGITLKGLRLNSYAFYLVILPLGIR